MKNKILKKSDLAPWVETLIKKGKVVGIREKEAGKYEFAALKNANELALGYDVSVTPPKKFIQPPKETLLTFKLDKGVKANAVVESEEMTLLGVHPYDMKAINQMDKVMTDDNKDTNYLARRKAIAIIGVDPVKASKWSFWASMGAAVIDKGYDLWLTDIGDKYYVEVATKAGDKLIGKAETKDATKEDDALRNRQRENLSKLCSVDRKVKANLNEYYSLFKNNYENKLWEERAKKCYSCGSCILVCPTCYCFDVREDIDLTLKSGKRTRYWDGCLLQDFAMVGHGENFREDKAARYRHRLFRKFAYMADKVGDVACVGCGRCSSICLPDITDPVKVINELKEGK